MRYFDLHIPSSLKKMAGIAVLILTVLHSQSQVFPVDTLVRNGERSNRINFVYLSDGYIASELPAYIDNASTINNALFSQTPFLEYQRYFNCYAVNVPSVESGAKHPRTATDESTSGGQPLADPDNYFQSTFDFSLIHRLLVPQNTADAYSVLASNLPDYDQPVVVVNSPYYGGSGGAFSAASADPFSAEVAIHEIGHSFAGLADEYWAGDVFAAEKPNLTQNSDPATIKWKNWLGINGVGIYPHTESPTWFRPHQLCKMRYLGYPFCSVCTERFVDRIHQLVSMIDTNTPAATSFTLSNSNDVDLAVTTVQTNPSTINVSWYLNGSATPFATGQESVTIPYSSLVDGNNTVRVEVIDNTTLSKSYTAGVGYVDDLTWTVNKPVVLPLRLKDFAGKINQFTGSLNWQIDNSADLEQFELEKGNDGSTFSKLVTIEGLPGKNSYTFNDLNLLTPVTYYRLKIIEKSGTVFYSNILRLQSAFDKLFYKVYQDADNHKYHLKIGLNVPEKIAIKITDASGRQILRKDFGVAQAGLDYDIDLATKPAGVYFLGIDVSNKHYAVHLLAK